MSSETRYGDEAPAAPIGCARPAPAVTARTEKTPVVSTTPSAVLCTFDLIELDGEDLRRLPTEERKQTLGKLIWQSYPGLAIQPGPRRRWRCRLPAGLQARLREYRVEATRLALAIMSL